MDEQSKSNVIYIIDENDDDRLIMSYDFEVLQSGASLHFFPDIDALIDYCSTSCKADPPNLILLDGFMKKDDLNEVVSIIKSIPDFQAVPVVVMIDSKQEKAYLRSFHLDVSGYVIKPINIHILDRFLKKK